MDADAGDRGTHYAAVAARYDEHWTYRPGYPQWMAEQICRALQLRASDRITDIGCGTGLFTREVVRIVRPTLEVLCVDPSPAMLRGLGDPAPRGLRPLQASAEQIAAAIVPLPASHQHLDAIWLKEVVHHLTDPAATLAGLARILAPGGRLLIIMLPTEIHYPLFPAALRRFEHEQPDPHGIAAHCADAGLAVAVTHVAHTVRIDRDTYIDMVRHRYMSVLSTFTDTDLANGVRWMRNTLPPGTLVFPDRFVFITAAKRKSPQLLSPTS